MFTALQLAGLVLVVIGATMLGGVGGAIVGAGIAVGYVGLAGER